MTPDDPQDQPEDPEAGVNPADGDVPADGGDGGAADGGDQASESAFSDLVDGIDIDADAVEAEVAAQAAADDGPVDPLVAVTAERDGYLDALQRLKAEFDNHRKRTAQQATDQRQQAASGFAEKLLPVLDACDAARQHHAEGVAPIHDQLLEVLTNGGLEILNPIDEPFDPEQHEAVMHEEGDPQEVPVVTEVLRAGYGWNGRILRPAMVKVRG